VWSTKIVLDGNDKNVNALVEKLDAAYDASVADAKAEYGKPGKNIKKADRPYTRDDDGNVVINVKQTASGISKKTKKAWSWTLPLFDAAGNPIKGKRPKVANGSTGKVSFEVSPFYTATVGAGITLRLQAAQIIELVEFGGGKAEDHGFGAEDGYTHTEEAEAEESFSPTTKAEESDEDENDGDY
jgi:hypothetical protein